MRSLDDLIADINRLETEQHDELRPLPGESVKDFKRRMLAEFDALYAEEGDGGGMELGWGAWRWKPEPAVEAIAANKSPSYLIEPWEISRVLPNGGTVTTYVGGKLRGVLNAADASWVTAVPLWGRT